MDARSLSEMPITLACQSAVPSGHKLTAMEQILVDIGHFGLSCLYVTVAIIAILMRFGTQPASTRIVWQRTFSATLLLGIICRCVSFFLQPFNAASIVKISNPIQFILGTFPPFLFLSCYMLILFLWAEIYHDMSGMNTKRLRYVFFAIQAIIYITITTLFTVDVILYPDQHCVQVNIATPLESGVMIVDSTLYILTALGYLIYGIGFYYKFTGANKPLLSKMRLTILPKVKYFTAVCTFCFLFRGALTMWNSLENWPNDFWWIDPVYYVFLEILPILLMLFILRPSNTPNVVSSDRPINDNPYQNAYSSSDTD